MVLCDAATRKSARLRASMPSGAPSDVLDRRERDYAPTYTASLDAAIALAERILPGCGLLLGKGRTRPDEPLFGAQIYATAMGYRDEEPVAEAEHNSSLALALCLAIIRALIAEQSK